jgi:hypothetical protein
MTLFGHAPAFPRAREVRDVLRASPLPPERSNWDLDADRLRAAVDAENDPARRARLLEALRQRLHALMRADGRPPRGANEELAMGTDGEPVIVWRQETYGADGRSRPVRRPGYPRR